MPRQALKDHIKSAHKKAKSKPLSLWVVVGYKGRIMTIYSGRKLAKDFCDCMNEGREKPLYRPVEMISIPEAK